MPILKCIDNHSVSPSISAFCEAILQPASASSAKSCPVLFVCFWYFFLKQLNFRWSYSQFPSMKRNKKPCWDGNNMDLLRFSNDGAVVLGIM